MLIGREALVVGRRDKGAVAILFAVLCAASPYSYCQLGAQTVRQQEQHGVKQPEVHFILPFYTS